MRELERITGPDFVTYDVRLGDACRTGIAPALVRPATAEQTAEVVAWCYAHDVPMIPVGGQTGLAGGCVPSSRDVVCISTDRLNRIEQLDPELWRMCAQAGVSTETVARKARENGLLFAPDPGAAEQSQLGGMIATNAGGPHAFKYGVTSDWVTGVQAVLAGGELAWFGGPVRKDVAGYDLRGLLCGSEGTLGLITSAWLRLIPAPETQRPVLACYPSIQAGCEAIQRVLAYGEVPAAIEFLDAETVRLSGGSYPDGALDGFCVLVEADGSHDEACRVRAELIDALTDDATTIHAPEAPKDISALWRWRSGVSYAVAAAHGAKLSEDVCVPVDRLSEAVQGTLDIGAGHGLPACSWGHAGDGNLHSSFLYDPADADAKARADAAAHDVFDLALRLGGTVSGEHGLGTLKNGQLSRQWAPAAVAAHRAVKQALDPKGLFNPGKKLP